MFASTAMPTVSTMPAMPGSDSDACSIDSSAASSTTFEQQHDVRDQAELPVVDDHEHEHREHADDQRAHAALDVVLAEARADGALLDDVERRRERAGAQQQRELARLARQQAGDLEVAAEHAADGGDADHLLLGALGAGTLAVAGLVLA